MNARRGWLRSWSILLPAGTLVVFFGISIYCELWLRAHAGRSSKPDFDVKGNAFVASLCESLAAVCAAVLTLVAFVRFLKRRWIKSPTSSV
jgi:hypothetical protein